MQQELKSCNCKGIRLCAFCFDSDRIKKWKQSPIYTIKDYSLFDMFIYCGSCQKYFPIDDQSIPSLTRISEITDVHICSLLGTSGIDLNGLLLIHDLISESEETELMQKIDSITWTDSQSGRRKQDYGPQVNFKKRKLKLDRFVGMPDYADSMLARMKCVNSAKLGNYLPLEMCNLEYDPDRKSNIDFHKDDSWIWGNRLISISLLSDSVMTMLLNDADNERNRLVFVPIPRRSLLCMADESRYRWEHGIFPEHVINRRVALTMREMAPNFHKSGQMYELFGRDLLILGTRRIALNCA